MSSRAKEDEEEEFESQGDIDGTTSQSDGSQPLGGGGGGGGDEGLLSISEHHMTTRSSGSAKLPSFPPPADVNTRFRRLVNAFIKIQRKEQSRMMQAKRVRGGKKILLLLLLFLGATAKGKVRRVHETEGNEKGGNGAEMAEARGIGFLSHAHVVRRRFEEGDGSVRLVEISHARQIGEEGKRSTRTILRGIHTHVSNGL